MGIAEDATEASGARGRPSVLARGVSGQRQRDPSAAELADDAERLVDGVRAVARRDRVR